MKTRHAFTLVEMLVVIAIIAIVAALVVNMNARAQNVKRNTAVNADKARLTHAIDTYQSKLNFYPPDNGLMANINSATNPLFYDAVASTNPLIYELTGATNNSINVQGNIQVFDGNPMISSTLYGDVFGGRSGVANSSTTEPQSFFQPGLQEYANYSNPYLNPGTNIWGLIVPVELYNYAFNNYWHYDASSPSRHNLNSYDLWAEYITGNQGGTPIITTNGNW